MKRLFPTCVPSWRVQNSGKYLNFLRLSASPFNMRLIPYTITVGAIVGLLTGLVASAKIPKAEEKTTAEHYFAITSFYPLMGACRVFAAGFFTTFLTIPFSLLPIGWTANYALSLLSYQGLKFLMVNNYDKK
jgi:hypothetical protein